LKTRFHILQGLAAFFGCLPSPASWRRPVVERVARTLVFAGVDALPLLLLTGMGLGSLAAQEGELWLSYTESARSALHRGHGEQLEGRR
jgi:hypothetical protein